MVIFILGVNLLNTGHGQIKYPQDKKSISTMTFKDMGVSEEKVRLFLESKKPSAVFFRYSLFAGFLMLMAGIAMNLIFLFGRKKMMPKKAQEKRSVSWSIMDVAKAALITVFSGYILAVSGPIIFKSFHFNIDINLRIMLGTFFIDIIAGAAIIWFVMIRYRERLSSLGITLKGFCSNVLFGVTAYVFVLPVLIAALILSMLFLDAIGYKPPPQLVFDMFFEERRSNVLLFLAIFVSILGPVIEEIFFRGFLYSAAKKRFGILLGALLSGALFSILHTNIAGFLPIMILGILMAFLYETTGSLISSMSAHILHNSIIVCFVFFIKELLR